MKLQTAHLSLQYEPRLPEASHCGATKEHTQSEVYNNEADNALTFSAQKSGNHPSAPSMGGRQHGRAFEHVANHSTAALAA